MTDYLTLTELPGNFKIRAVKLEDITGVVDVINTCDLEISGTAEASVTELLSEWEGPDFNLDYSRIVETGDGKIVGYVDLYFRSKPIKNIVWGKILPAYQNQGIGTFFMNWGEALASQLSESLPTDETPSLIGFIHENDSSAKTLFSNHGLTLERCYFTMKINLESRPPEATFPDHIQLTTFAEYDHLPDIWRANNESFRDHYGHVEIPEEEGIRNWQHIVNTAEFFDPALWFVALDGDEIAGICLCQPQTTEDPDKAHVHNLAVRRQWRKQGLGMALLQHAFGEFYKRGAKRADLEVDASSLTGATRLYEKAGMHKTRVHERYSKVIG